MRHLPCTRTSIRFGLAVLALVGLTGGGMAAEDPGAPFLVASDFDDGTSLTGGIQEAVDALPETGGMVFVPQGVHMLHAPILLKPRVTLRGAGPGSILRKAPLFQVMLAEDVENGADQDYIVVEGPAPFRPGLGGMIGDRKRQLTAPYIVLVDRVEGNRVYLRRCQVHSVGIGEWRPRNDYRVADGACFLNAFGMMYTREHCTITNLDIDGNKDGQRIDGEEVYKAYGGAWKLLRCTPYLSEGCVLSECLVHDAAGVNVSLSSPAVVRDCEIWGGFNGIHPGAGPDSKLIDNMIHHNHDGIFMCMGNKGVIIRGNHIYRNTYGITAMGSGERTDDELPDLAGDHLSIIANNVIEDNDHAGMRSSQGNLGPQDFVFMGNIVRNNHRKLNRFLGVHQMPAGISLYNAQRCVIMGNRCVDDRSLYPARTAEAAERGAEELVFAGHQTYVPMLAGRPQTRFRVRLSHEGRTAVHWARTNLDSRYQHPRKLLLEEPLDRTWPAGTRVSPEPTQLWGIIVAGPRSEDNVLSGNVCAQNGIGGVLYHGERVQAQGNVGRVMQADSAKSMEENVYPAARSVPVPNASFEADAAWSVGEAVTYVEGGYDGARALKLTNDDPASGTSSGQGPLPLKPLTRYRVSAWVKTNAKKGDTLVLPNLFLYDVGKRSGITLKAHPGTGMNLDRQEAKAGQWIRILGQGRTGEAPVRAQLYCNLARAVGEAWVDAVAVEELDELRPPIPAVPEDKTLAAPAAQAPVTVDGALEEPAWDHAAEVDGFVTDTGDPAQRRTVVRAIHDERNLYLAFECFEPNPDRIQREATSEMGVFGDDSVAVLIQPQASEPMHLQLAVSASGVRFDQYNNFACKDTTGYNPAWQAATRVGADRWTAEVAIPFALVGASAPDGEPAAPIGAAWGVNFGRVCRSVAQREYSAWTQIGNWHQVDNYGRLTFEK